MFVNPLRKTLLAVLTATAAVSSNSLLLADPPQTVVRTFAVFANSLEDLPDFLSDDSHAVIVAPAKASSPQGVIRFDSFSNCDADFNGTVWPLSQAMHIVRGREDLGAVAWQLTPDAPEAPPAGAITFTGPESPLILDQEILWVEQGFETGRLRVRCSPGGSAVILVVTARFFR